VVVAVYFGVFHYSPVALHHVPPGTTVAVRVDLVDAATFGPVRRNLIPLADEQAAGTPAAVGARKRSDRIADAVGFTPSRDIREVVVCFLGSEDHLVVIIGGNIPKGHLVPGLMKVVTAENSTAWVQAGDTMKAKNGSMVIGQADDGSALVASDDATLQAALASGDEYRRLGLSEDHSVSYAIAGDVWRRLATSTFGNLLESLQNLKSLDAASGYLTLSNAPRAETLVTLTAGANPEEAKASLFRIFTDLRRLSELRRKLTGGNDFAGEEQALAQSVIETRPPNQLRVVTPWPYDGLDRGAQSLAQKIRTLRDGLSRPAIPALPTAGPGNLVLPGLPIQIPLPGMP
jgi:hypothetical protein